MAENGADKEKEMFAIEVILVCELTDKTMLAVKFEEKQKVVLLKCF